MAAPDTTRSRAASAPTISCSIWPRILTNIDTILDFAHIIDEIVLDDAVFTALSVGALSASAFVTGTAAGDADDRIIYDATTGALYYDADGNGAGAAVQFATLSNQPANLSANDFFVI